MTTNHIRDDDRMLRRREALAALGGAIAATWYAVRSAFDVRAASAADRCVLAPEQTAGPFYVAGEAFRSDVTEDRPGVPLRVKFKLEDATTCKRIAGATVEIWHADAAGAYSGVGGAATTFLRGQQTTDAGGRATFETIYPGWYVGRTAHLHVKAHVGGTVIHTGQLYFDDAVTDAVYRRQPYAARGARTTTNATDGLYGDGGARSKLKLRKRHGTYRGRMVLAVAS